MFVQQTVAYCCVLHIIMSKIEILSNTDSYERVLNFLTDEGYTESFCPEKLMDTHFFIVNRTAQTFELCNMSKRISKKLNAIDDPSIETKLMEFMLEGSYLEPYYIRLKPSIFKKAEKYRADRGLSKSGLGNLIFGEFDWTK